MTEPSSSHSLKAQETNERGVARIFGPVLVILGLAQPFSIVAMYQVGYMINASMGYLIVFYTIEIVGVLMTLIGAVSFIKLARKLVMLAAASALVGLIIIPLAGLLPEFLSFPTLLPILAAVTATNLIVLGLCRAILRK